MSSRRCRMWYVTISEKLTAKSWKNVWSSVSTCSTKLKGPLPHNHREHGNQTYLVPSHISHRNFSLPIYCLPKWQVCVEYFDNKTSFFLWRLQPLLTHTAAIPHYRNCTTWTFIQPFVLTSLMAALSSSPGRTSLFPVNFMESPKSLITHVPSFFTSTLRLFKSRWDIAGL